MAAPKPAHRIPDTRGRTVNEIQHVAIIPDLPIQPIFSEYSTASHNLAHPVSVSHEDAREEESSSESTFVDQETLGLRRSECIAKRGRLNYFGMMVLGLTTITDLSTSFASEVTHCF